MRDHLSTRSSQIFYSLEGIFLDPWRGVTVRTPHPHRGPHDPVTLPWRHRYLIQTRTFARHCEPWCDIPDWNRVDRRLWKTWSPDQETRTILFSRSIKYRSIKYFIECENSKLDVDTHCNYINTIDTSLKLGHNECDEICCWPVPNQIPLRKRWWTRLLHTVWGWLLTS